MELWGGFTLIEVMVALGVFSIAMLIVTGGFVRALKTERQASSFTYVNDNLSTIIEQITREIRTAKDICTGNTSCSSQNTISFVDAYGNDVTYCLQNAAIVRNSGLGCGSGQTITSSKVSISYLSFIISGNRDNDHRPPRVTILISGGPKDQSASSYKVNLQTTVSSRIIGT
ncbi:MAG: prepilin-type N-terminal cleavage/methylation domain-containing protein [Candidatus Liptonbacteria bacterium]|nr:prepilin-type N-terminal cleavage/methylation domain-containing protein [Candidatus Liptonbacteria bacterium]